MSTEHKRPLYAFAILALACALFVGNGLRSDAIGGVLRADDRVAAFLSVLPPVEEKVASVPAPTPAATSNLRTVSTRSDNASVAAAVPSPREIATARVTHAKAPKHKKAPKATVARPSLVLNGPAASHSRGDARGHRHARGHDRSQKSSRGTHTSRDHGHRGTRGQQHRPREQGPQGRGGEHRHQRGKSGQRQKGHDTRQGSGHHRQGGKWAGKTQKSQRGGRGSSASHSRHRV